MGRVGGMESNGGYFIHTHLQVLTERGYQEGLPIKVMPLKNNF
ncbi:MAG: hypothetical protein R2728_04165 [Chitinophagales bacterium]